jgi:PKHD-type hydroxylase
MVWALKLDTMNSSAYMDQVFTKEECEKIIEIGNKAEKIDGTLKNNLLDYALRKSKVAWIKPEPENRWIYERITNCVNILNDNFFHFDLFGMMEYLQFSEYNAPDDHMTEHIDQYVGGSIRKLSISIQLSDPNDYEGGDLKIIDCADPSAVKKDQGTAIAFPSFMLHKVEPVIKGTRYTIVAWVSGNSFK